jgi:cytochrome b561
MLKNTDARYGLVAKSLHWLVFLLIVNQFAVATAMLNVPAGETLAGFSGGALYNWHKSIGLIAFVAAFLRLIWRKATDLPEWAPNLSLAERQAIAWIERVLYTSMFLMPLSGFVFVTAGDFGVNFFSRWEMPRFIEPNSTAAAIAQRTHEITAGLLAMGLLAHWILIARHQWTHADRYLQRMLPFTHQD